MIPPPIPLALEQICGSLGDFSQFKALSFPIFSPHHCLSCQVWISWALHILKCSRMFWNVLEHASLPLDTLDIASFSKPSLSLLRTWGFVSLVLFELSVLFSLSTPGHLPTDPGTLCLRTRRSSKGGVRTHLHMARQQNQLLPREQGRSS